MTVGVVTNEVAIVEPQHTLGVKHIEQTLLNFGLFHRLVAMWGKQTLACCEDCSLAVALNGAAFKYKACTVLVLTLYNTGIIQLTVYGIVKCSLKLASPAIEAEVYIVRHIAAEQGDESVVTRPGVIGIALKECYVRCWYFIGLQQCAYLFNIRGYNEQMLACTDGGSELHIAGFNLVQHIMPVGFLVRPSKLHHLLVVPLGRHI